MTQIKTSNIYKIYKAIHSEYNISTDSKQDKLGERYPIFFKHNFIGSVYPELKEVHLLHNEDKHIPKLASLLDLSDLEGFTINI